MRDVRGPVQGRNTSNARELATLARDFGLHDAWVLKKGGTFVPTWKRGTSETRLDRFYVSEGLIPVVADVAVGSFPPESGRISDHYPVILSMALPDRRLEGKRFWKFDLAVLADDEAKDILRAGINRTLTNARNPSLEWDALKSQWQHWAKEMLQVLHRAVFSFFWDGSTERLQRDALRLPRCLGGYGLPCIGTMAQLLALRTVLGILGDVGAPARPLAMFFLGPLRRTLVPRALGNLYPSAVITPAYYRALVAFLTGTHGFGPRPKSTGSSASKAITQRGCRPTVAEGLAYLADPGSPPAMGDSAVCEVPQLRQYRNSGTRRLDLCGRKDLLATGS
ncbi:hypothetical protein HPB52_002654 [Rhipicephalus sanguineus]|uniref:Uncharacterized protein n=1 Tax=Rhipicephalus sanguineus TaxID=34632 RepID=A0A9D4PCR1_RHISA|nr:hypothetical protein HPB52_002654 [Rhipicephalus sanguineus]